MDQKYTSHNYFKAAHKADLKAKLEEIEKARKARINPIPLTSTLERYRLVEVDPSELGLI